MKIAPMCLCDKIVYIVSVAIARFLFVNCLYTDLIESMIIGSTLLIFREQTNIIAFYKS